MPRLSYQQERALATGGGSFLLTAEGLSRSLVGPRRAVSRAAFSGVDAASVGIVPRLSPSLTGGRP